jgi:hypothetical protein
LKPSSSVNTKLGTTSSICCAINPIAFPLNATGATILGLFLILKCSSSQTNVTPSILFAVSKTFSSFVILSFNLLSDGGP